MRVPGRYLARGLVGGWPGRAASSSARACGLHAAQLDTRSRARAHLYATAIREVDGSVVRIDKDEPLGAVSFAPEQLVARVGAEWTSEHIGKTLASLPPQLPASLAVEEEVLLPLETGRFDGPGLG